MVSEFIVCSIVRNLVTASIAYLYFLLIEEDARNPSTDRFQRASRSESDDGLPRGLRLDRCDAEIFLAGKNKSPAVRIVLRKLVPRQACQ